MIKIFNLSLIVILNNVKIRMDKHWNQMTERFVKVKLIQLQINLV